jgi:clathrin heavy chain
MISPNRGVEYASEANKPEVWSRLAKAQLDGLRIEDSIGTYRARLHVSQWIFNDRTL